MTLRIIDAEEQLNAAIAQLESALIAWAGVASEIWRSEGEGVDGAAYARRDDVYVYLEKTPESVRIGAALSDRDRDLLRIALPRLTPAEARKRWAIAQDDEESRAYLLIAADELRRQGLRDPFRRLAGVNLIKKANVAERDFVLLGPISEPAIGDALLSLAGLSPRFERHVEQLGALAGAGTDGDNALYAASWAVERRQRARLHVRQALEARLGAAGFSADIAESGPLRADFAMSRGAETLVIEIRDKADVDDVLTAVGRLALVAPQSAGLVRVLALPAPRDAAQDALDTLKPALTEMGLSVLLFDFDGKRTTLSLALTDASLAPELAAILADS